MSAETIKSKRPDTTGLYSFIWFTESGMPWECYLYFDGPDPAGHFMPGADLDMELRYVLPDGEHDIADTLRDDVCRFIEMAALHDATKAERAAMGHKWITFTERYSRSLANFLG